MDVEPTNMIFGLRMLLLNDEMILEICSVKVFLDIDGVMIPANAWRRPEILPDGFPAFSLKAVEALRKIVSAVDPEIVLTSSHKSNYSLAEWKALFRSRGIKDIKALPENTEQLSRRDELLRWFAGNHLTDNFVIIDDDKSLNALPSLLKEKLVLTSGGIGLTIELADEAIAVLNKKASPATT
jgi:hypothetical protein